MVNAELAIAQSTAISLIAGLAGVSDWGPLEDDKSRAVAKQMKVVSAAARVAEFEYPALADRAEMIKVIDEVYELAVLALDLPCEPLQ